MTRSGSVNPTWLHPSDPGDIQMPTLGETPDREPSEEHRASGRSEDESDRLKVRKPWGWLKPKQARRKMRERRKRNVDPYS